MLTSTKFILLNSIGFEWYVSNFQTPFGIEDYPTKIEKIYGKVQRIRKILEKMR